MEQIRGHPFLQPRTTPHLFSSRNLQSRRRSQPRLQDQPTLDLVCFVSFLCTWLLVAVNHEPQIPGNYSGDNTRLRGSSTYLSLGLCWLRRTVPDDVAPEVTSPFPASTEEKREASSLYRRSRHAKPARRPRLLPGERQPPRTSGQTQDAPQPPGYRPSPRPRRRG